MSLVMQLAGLGLGIVAERLVKETLELVDGHLNDEQADILASFAKRLRESDPDARDAILRRVALELGYERLAEGSMDAALKAAKKLP